MPQFREEPKRTGVVVQRQGEGNRNGKENSVVQAQIYDASRRDETLAVTPAKIQKFKRALNEKQWAQRYQARGPHTCT